MRKARQKGQPHIKPMNSKELKSFEKANESLLASPVRGQDFESHYGNFIVCITVLPKLEEDRKIQVKEKAEEWEGTSVQQRIKRTSCREEQEETGVQKPRWQFDIDIETQLVTKRNASARYVSRRYQVVNLWRLWAEASRRNVLESSELFFWVNTWEFEF